MSRGHQKIMNQQKNQKKQEELRRAQGNSGAQEKVQKCKTIQCSVCKQTFMGSTTEGELHNHSDNKHPKQDFAACFPNWQEQAAKLTEVLKK